MDRTATSAVGTPTSESGAKAPRDGRRWLVRKAMANRDNSIAAPFDSKKASIIGPDTEPIWLAPEAEYDALLRAAEDVLASWRGGASMGHALEGLFEAVEGS